MSYFIYGNGGGIDKVIAEMKHPERTFETIVDVLKYIKDAHPHLLNMEDLSIRYYGYDDRINKDAYMIVTKRMGHENYIQKYKCPQFVNYMVKI